MPKTKTIRTNCSLCNKIIEIDVPDDLAKDRDYYPFEYIHIHGKPEHVLMLFLDQNLAVRESVVYKDMQHIKEKKKEYKSLLSMSEIDSLYAIYSDPIRLKIFKELIKGPKTEEDLIELVKDDAEFRPNTFDLIILPFLKSGLVKSSWLSEGFMACYFLVKDFLVFRKPSKIVFKRISNNNRYKPYSETYTKKVDIIVNKYAHIILSGNEKRDDEIRICLKILKDLKFQKVILELLYAPLESTALVDPIIKAGLEFLLENEFAIELWNNNENLYFLTTDILVKTFVPKYIVNKITEKLNTGKITKEIALKHLQLLYDAEEEL